MNIFIQSAPVSRQDGDVIQWSFWIDAISTDTFPCRNSVQLIKSWPAAAALMSAEAKLSSSTKEVNDRVPRNRRYFSIQCASSWSV